MFAVITFDREPLRVEDLPAGIVQWTQSVGGFATIGLILFFLVALPRWRPQDYAAVPGWLKTFFLSCCGLSALFYIAAGIGFLTSGADEPDPEKFVLTTPNLLLTLAGACSILAAGLPFILNLFRERFRRIYALAKLSFKEAIRRRVIYAFSGMLLVFLFASWFIPSWHKDQVRTYVGVVFLAMNALLLFTAALLSSFSIPSDIKQQTIHTIVTKPVERFEIVLGRFFGFLALMTLVLVAMTGISLLYVLRGIHPEAAAESLKARVPYYGDLLFENTDDPRKGTNVGREWEYRDYITRPMPGQPAQTARWDFVNLPASLANRPEVRCEYTFDVYRTTKGEEGKDVYCTFRFYSWRFRKGDDEAFRKEREERGKGLIEGSAEEIALNNELAEKYGFFERDSRPVTDYRTLSLTIPGGLIKNALQADPERESELKLLGPVPAPLQCRVTCDSYTQYVGMAKRDLYFRLDEREGSDRVRFAINFFKGAFGLWLQMALIIGLAVVLSTYLNGVISLLITMILFFGGLGREFVAEVAVGKNEGGGPLEAMVRITRRELSGASFSESTSISDQIVSGTDEAFRWVVRRIIDVIPDVDRFEMSNYVAEGFDISWTQMGLSGLLLFAYLAPWFVLAFYLMRWREIASST